VFQDVKFTKEEKELMESMIFEIVYTDEKPSQTKSSSETLFFPSLEAYTAWFTEHGFRYNTIKILSRNPDGVTVTAVGKEGDSLTLSKEKLFTELVKFYPPDTMLGLPTAGMIFDALEKKTPWENVAKNLKESRSALALSTFYRLWKNDRTAFDLLKTDPLLGWKNISETGAKFLCTVQEEEFIKMVFAECTVSNGDGNVLIHAVKLNARNFIKYALPSSVTGIFVMNLYKAGMTELIPNIFKNNLNEEQKVLFLQHLMFHDIELFKELVPHLTKKVTTTFVYSLKVMGENDIVDALKILKLAD
jgi:hypothetical protein